MTLAASLIDSHYQSLVQQALTLVEPDVPQLLPFTSLCLAH